MAGYFQIGEKKVRPGSYFHIINNGDESTSDIVNGVTAVVFKSDFGPLGKASVLTAEEGYKELYGTGGTTDAIDQVIKGGAKTIIACRLGSGGTESSVTLKGKVGTGDEENVITIKTRYPGSKAFTVTIKEKLTDTTMKQAVFYEGTTEFNTVEFPAGEGEAQALADALEYNATFVAAVTEGKGAAVLSAASQSAFTGGTDPTITNADYSEAFLQIEPYQINTICVDSNDIAIHTLLHAFIQRVYENGNLCIGVIAEAGTTAYDTRIAHAKSYNDERMVYVLNASAYEGDTLISGYQVAARMAGLIGAVTSSQSLTHYVLHGFTDIAENLPNGKIITALKSGCFVLSLNSDNQVWVEQGITTLVNPPEDRDSGWKKIRRTKTRFELLRRCNDKTDKIIGKVNNDANGRKTVIGKLLEVGAEMISEGKIVSLEVYEDPQNVSDGDTAYFKIDVIDMDSIEHIYSIYGFQFSVNG